MSTTRLLSTVTAIALVTGQMAGAAAAEGVAESAIVVTCPVACEVVVDGVVAGRVPEAGGVLRVVVMPGEHLVQGKSSGGQVSEQRLVRVLEGHSVVVTAEFSEDGAEIESPESRVSGAGGQRGIEGGSTASTSELGEGSPPAAPVADGLTAADVDRAARIRRAQVESIAMLQERFLSTGEGTTLHLETGLEWAHCDYLASGTRDLWRVPTIEELEALYAAVAEVPHESTLQGSAWRPIPGIPPLNGNFASTTRVGKGEFQLDFLDGQRRERMDR